MQGKVTEMGTGIYMLTVKFGRKSEQEQGYMPGTNTTQWPNRIKYNIVTKQNGKNRLNVVL